MSSEEHIINNNNRCNSNENKSLPQNTDSSSSSEEENAGNNNFPEVPSSPSSKLEENSNSTENTFMESKTEAAGLSKKEIHRKPNAEYNSLFLLNIWFCFYFRFVCRCIPIQDEDIYEINPENKTDLVTDKVAKYWGRIYKEYVGKSEEYENERKINPKFKIVEYSYNLYYFIMCIYLIFIY